MENLQLFISLIEGTNDIIHSISKDGNFEFVNRSWLETLGYEGNDVKDIRFPKYSEVPQVETHPASM